jgi:hypothetical protein
VYPFSNMNPQLEDAFMDLKIRRRLVIVTLEEQSSRIIQAVLYAVFINNLFEHQIPLLLRIYLKEKLNFLAFVCHLIMVIMEFLNPKIFRNHSNH